MNHPELYKKSFLALLIAVTIAFGWILMPFYGAVFWAAVFALLFAPLQRRLLARLKQRRNWAALLTLVLCLLLVILPTTLIVLSLAKDAAVVFGKIKSGDIDFAAYFEQFVAALPQWLVHRLEEAGLLDLGSLQSRISNSIMQGSQSIATQAISFSQNTMDFVVSFFVMLYVMFFLLRDGANLAYRVRDAIPLSPVQKRYLVNKFTTVIRATVKGNVAVAAVQGALGGIIFWFLGVQGALVWAVIMGILSLLPAIGAAIVWLPVAIYFMVSGALVKGLILTAFGTLVIGLVDNVLRPILVGKDTQMPDYVVLVSTLGGMALFGLNGFVIGPAVAALFIACWDLFTSPTDAPPPTEDR